MASFSPPVRRSPISAGRPLTVIRPSAIQRSISRREPYARVRKQLVDAYRLGFRRGRFLRRVVSVGRFFMIAALLVRSWLGRQLGKSQVKFYVDAVEIANLRQRRQVLQAFQPEIIEEISCRGVHRRPPGHIAVADDAHPASLGQGPHDVGADADPADVLDLATRDGLPVGDQRQRLEQRARVPCWPVLPEPRQPAGHLLANLDAPAARHLEHADAAPG
jgi:hypothetical protein